MLEATRNSSQKLELRQAVLLVNVGNIAVNQPTDESVQKNDEDGTQSRAEEQKPAVLGEFVSGVLETKSQEVEEQESSETDRGVQYVESRVEKPVIPIKVGTWPTQILMADPVMNAEIEVREMKSTSQPRRTRPKKQTMAPTMIESADAIT
ncbi:hypothetical protein KCU94_g137, partial [Aureobasidium melanogenum]